jgi:uncharacterized protein
MTPQEKELVEDLFDRLTKLESAPRDADAERLIAAGLQQAPHAVYALVQTALVQDEALKRANARIEELQAQLDADDDRAQAPEQRPASFLDSMREAFTGRVASRGSVPSVRGSAPGNEVETNRPQGYAPQPDDPRQAGYPQPGYPPQPAVPPYAGGPGFGSGGSFLGGAASTAAGVIGGSLLLDGIRSMFGPHVGRPANALGDLAGGQASPWSGSAADSQLARDAGIGHIGQAATHDAGSHPSAVADTTPQDADVDNVADDNDFDDDNFDDESDFDVADDGDDSYDA